MTPYFHTVYDIRERPASSRRGAPSRGLQELFGRRTRRALAGHLDDKGRIMVAISHNSDLGDAWEFADAPHYPEKESTLAIQIAVNDVIYAMTH